MKRVGVLMGGPSSEHDISLLSAANIMRALKARYTSVPIFISQNGVWLYGENREWVSPHEALGRVDVIFNALHGEFGEDGTVQQILNSHGVPYTGSGALSSAFAMNKEKSHELFSRAGLRVPRSIVLGPKSLDTRSVLALSAPPWIIKPRSRGSSVGVSKVMTREALLNAFQKALAYDGHIIAQEYIPGREVTVGVLERQDGSHEALMPVEIIVPNEAHFFDTSVKYNAAAYATCPAEFYGAMLAYLRETAVRAHEALGLGQYSRVDMIIKPSSATRRAPEIYVLEANSLPELSRQSLFLKALERQGIGTADFAHHAIELALRGTA